MSKDTKFFAKPKVRFCQAADCEEENEDSKNSVQQKSVERSNVPKIRSIVTLDKPIKILNHNNVSNIQKTNDPQHVNNSQKGESLSQFTETFSSLCITSDNTKNQESVNDTNHSWNIQGNFKNTGVLETVNDHNESSVPLLTLPFEGDKLGDKVLKSQNNVKANVSKGCMKTKIGKENQEFAAQKNIKRSKKGLSGNLSTGYQKTKTGSSVSSSRKSNILSKSPSMANRHLHTKPVSLMPCHKYNKVPSKVKTSPVKKTVIRDATGQKIKPYIGAGILHKKHDNIKQPESSENIHVQPNNSGERLARPQYNSIMCTINKLKKVKKQKIVTDVEHLPTAYQNLVNRKVTAALDFQLDDVTYKNLVDLSIDEKQLPGRVTRSKDPEPRQRDIVPVLSDFFEPISTEEYCTPVSIKPRTPENVESWTAFRISEKIFEWKHNMEYM